MLNLAINLFCMYWSSKPVLGQDIIRKQITLSIPGQFIFIIFNSTQSKPAVTWTGHGKRNTDSTANSCRLAWVDQSCQMHWRRQCILWQNLFIVAKVEMFRHTVWNITCIVALQVIVKIITCACPVVSLYFSFMAIYVYIVIQSSDRK